MEDNTSPPELPIPGIAFVPPTDESNTGNDVSEDLVEEIIEGNMPSDPPVSGIAFAPPTEEGQNEVTNSGIAASDDMVGERNEDDSLSDPPVSGIAFAPPTEEGQNELTNSGIGASADMDERIPESNIEDEIIGALNDVDSNEHAPPHLTISVDAPVHDGFDCTSPSHDLAGYPPDCGTKSYKYLSYAKCRRDRGLTHPMCYSTTELDKMGHHVPKFYPVISTDFGAHSFHTLPTDSQVLSKYGIGVSLYFKFLKVMSWLFLIMFIISLPALLVYIISGSTSVEAMKIQLQNSPISILGMTSMGHLGESIEVCAQAKYGETLTLTCPYGEIGSIKTSYSLYASQGSCACPSSYQANSKGECRGTVSDSICPKSGSGCYLGSYPSSANPCCAYNNDASGIPSFDELLLKDTPGCSSPTALPILKGLCLGQSTCSLPVNDSEVFLWKFDSAFNTKCTDPKEPMYCQARLTDNMTNSSCSNTATSRRGLIATARCLTTKIEISKFWAFRIMGWDTITRQDFVGFACALDIIYSIVFIIVVLWMKQQEKLANARIIHERLSVENYTVQLMHLPSHKDVPQLADELKTHLETLLTNKPPIYNENIKEIKIADINFGQTNAPQINVMRKRGEVASKLEVAQQRIAKFKKLQDKLDEKIFEKRVEKLIKNSQEIDEKFSRYEKWLDEWEEKNKGKRLHAVTAYITFEEEEGYLRCLREYPDLGVLHRLFQPYHKRFKKKRMWITTAPNPTDIIWENLDFTTLNRFFRTIIVNIVALSLLCVSFIIIYAAKIQKNELSQKYGAPVACPTEEISQWDVIQEQTGDSGDQTMVMCFCKQALLSTSLRAAMNIEFIDRRTGISAKYCDTWGTQYLEIQALMIASVLIVVVINGLLTPVLRSLVLKQKSHTRSGVVVSTVNKIFITQFFNTALIILFLNANMDEVMRDSSEASIGGKKIFSGKYSDFTVSWYNDVGIALMLTMLINIISPHVSVFLTYIYLEFKRFLDRGLSFDFTISKQDTQRDLEALYRGPDFDLASRYSVVINTIFITLLFSSGMPLLLLIGLFSVILTYWTDKFTFLRVVRSPPQFDGEIARAAGNLLPWAILLHTLFGIWMYSNTDIFETSDLTISAFDSINTQLQRGGRIVARATTMPSGIMFVVLIAIVAVALFRIIIFRYVVAVIRSIFPNIGRMLKEPKEPRYLPNYFDAIPTHILRENLALKTLKPHLRESYVAALTRRGLSRVVDETEMSRLSNVDSQAELDGCHSYDILANPIYSEAFGGGAFR